MMRTDFPLVIFVAALFAVSVEGRPSIQNVNVTAIYESQKSNVVCTRTNWYNVLFFFFANYLMHALSVRSLPGDNAFASIAFKLCCLLIPYTGLRRGLCLISRASNLTGSDLQGAARANALCMVIRTSDWKPENGDNIKGCRVELATEGSQHDLIEATEAKAPFTTTSEETSSTRSVESIADEKGCARQSEIIASTSSDTDASTTNARGNVALEITDPYTPPPFQGIIDRTFRLLIQTYRFSNHAPSPGRRFNRSDVKVHGLCRLVPGYGLAYVPQDMKVSHRHGDLSSGSMTSAILALPRSITEGSTAETKLASTRDGPRILFSILQTISGGWSLYRVRGSQIDRYGFTAFGLTVVPYMVVSIVNFVGSLLTSEYEMVYLVHSAVMDEMVQRGGATDGVVGTINNTAGSADIIEANDSVNVEYRDLLFKRDGDLDSDQIRFCDAASRASFMETHNLLPSPPPKPLSPRPFWAGILDTQCWRRLRKRADHPERPPNTTVISIPSHPPFIRIPPAFYQPLLNLSTIVLLLLALVVPYLVIYLLSGFKNNQSTGTQRSFTLNWLICGQVLGYEAGRMEKLAGRKAAMHGLLVAFVVYGSYCICGFVMVAQQMMELGTCETI